MECGALSAHSSSVPWHKGLAPGHIDPNRLLQLNTLALRHMTIQDDNTTSVWQIAISTPLHGEVHWSGLQPGAL